MTAHKHAAMIKAKADNMDLVAFVKRFPHWETDDHLPPSAQDIKERWFLATEFQWEEDAKYFLCLPKHNESGQCLHWLNDGDVEFRRDGEEWQNECEKYHGWTDYCGMMNPDVEFRIKPRKEKRWICVTDNLEIEDGTLYESYADADENSPGYKQIVEIEVEV